MQDPTYDPTWIDRATPEQLLEAGQRVLAKIGGLGQDYRDQFTAEIRKDAKVAKLMQHPLETTTR